MFKKTLAAIFCTVLAASALTSCGKHLEVDDSDSNDKSVSDEESTKAPSLDEESTKAPSSGTDNKTIDLSRFTDRSVPDIDLENSSVKNFTTPEIGDDIIIMKFQGYEGEVKIRLFPEYAELGSENFVGLSEKGYYDGLTFHRIMADFMIQGGDPLGTGTGGESLWGDKFDGGTDPNVIHASGAIAYANSGSTATNGSQFYIVTGEKYTKDYLDQIAAYNGSQFSDDAAEVYSTTGGAAFLDGSYTVFGQVYQGLDIIYAVQDLPVHQGNAFSSEVSTPDEPVVLEYVKVGKYEGEELKWFISDYMGEDSPKTTKDSEETNKKRED